MKKEIKAIILKINNKTDDYDSNTTHNNDKDTEVITLIKAIMVSVNNRLDHMENILSKHDNQLNRISQSLDKINMKLA